MNPETTTLYRPVGQKELDLIREGGFTAFPPLPLLATWHTAPAV